MTEVQYFAAICIRTFFAGGKQLKKLFVTMFIKNVTEEDDSQVGSLGRYECHAFAVGDSSPRKHGFTFNVITCEYYCDVINLLILLQVQ